MNEVIPKEAINEGLGQLLGLLPIPFILLVLMVVIGFGIVKFDGSAVKYWILYTILTVASLAGIAYLLIPAEDLKIKEASTLVISAIASIFLVRLFIYWRQNKKK